MYSGDVSIAIYLTLAVIETDTLKWGTCLFPDPNLIEDGI